jgi:hypothetical protein
MNLHSPIWIAALALLAACTGMPDRPPHDTQPTQAAMRQAAAALLDGIRLYDNGNFKGAIVALDTPAMQAAPDALRLEALKYTAFSHCVLEDYAPCRQAFDLALAIDPGFELGKSERGHPMWGPVFDAAKAASEQARAHTSLDDERERWRGIDLWRAR